jgi:hypothetical protein
VAEDDRLPEDLPCIRPSKNINTAANAVGWQDFAGVLSLSHRKTKTRSFLVHHASQHLQMVKMSRSPQGTILARTSRLVCMYANQSPNKSINFLYNSRPFHNDKGRINQSLKLRGPVSPHPMPMCVPFHCYAINNHDNHRSH